MEGMYTVNVDGSGEQLIIGGGAVPAWQSADVPAGAAPATQAPAPKPPSTGYAPAGQASPSLVPVVVFWVVVAVVVVVVVIIRRHRSGQQA